MQPLLLALFGGAFALGQLGAVTLAPGIRISFLDIATVLILAYCAFNQRGKRLLPALWPPIIAFAGVGLVSVFINMGEISPVQQGAGLLYLVRFLAYAGLYWAAATSTVPKKSWFKTLYWAGLAVAVLGFVQYAWYPNLRNLYYLGWDPHFQRLFSTILDPNFTGLLLVLTGLLGFGLRMPIAAQLMVGIALLLTYSRSSFIALVAAGIVLALRASRLRAWIAGLFLVFFLFLLVLPRSGEGRNLLRTASGLARIENFQEGMRLFGKSPLIGYGLNTLRSIRETPREDSRADAGFDMSIVFVLVTTGSIGLGAFIWMIGRLLVQARGDMYLSASLAAVFVHSLFVNSLFYPWVMAFVWIWVGTTPGEHAVQPSSGSRRRPRQRS